MNAFFFAQDGPRRLALIRILLGSVLLYDAVIHWRYAIELYSRSGPPMPIFVRTLAKAPDAPVAPDESRVSDRPYVAPLLPATVPSPPLAVLAHSLLVFALLSVAFGWRTRTSLIGAIILLLWLGPLDLPGTFAKHTVIALHLLSLLAFSGCGEVWSIDACAVAREASYCRLSSAAPRRLMQMLICCVYLGAAITKIKTPSFTNGDLLTFSLLDDHWGGGWPALWLSTMPHATLLLSLATILYEFLFPVLVWVPRLRIFVLGLAVAVHTSMAGLLNLDTFSPIMIAGLLSFAREGDLTAVGGRIHAFSVWSGIRGISAGLSSAADERSADARGAKRWRFGMTWYLCGAAAFMSAGKKASRRF